MDYSKIELIVRIIATCFSVLSLVISFLAARYGGKWKKLAATSSSINDYTATLMAYIKEAETFTNYTAQEKLSHVVIKFALWCMNTNTKFDENTVIREINDIVDFTKQVNAKE